MVIKMQVEEKLTKAGFLGPSTLAKLEALEIHTVQQLYARLRNERTAIQDYLKLSPMEFENFYNQVEQAVQKSLLKNLSKFIPPVVNTRWVAAHRLKSRLRPKYVRPRE